VAAADKTVNEYWDTGQLYSTSVGGSPKVRYDYRAEGWQLWRLPETAEGTGTAYYARMMLWEYYPDGLLKGERDLAGQRSSYLYDPNGNQTSASQAQSIAGDILAITSSFNGFDELQKVITPKTGTANNRASSFTYDQHGNVASLHENREETAAGASVADPRVFAYTYDHADQPLQQSDDVATSGTLTDDEKFSFGFDELGRLKKRTVAKRLDASSYATEQTQETTYFLNGLTKTLVSKDGAATQIASHTLSYLQGGIYLNGNKSQDIFRVANPDTAAPCRTSDCTASWEYDGQERLTKAVDGTGTTSEFTLDPAGNVTLEKRNGASHRTATYAGQRLTTDTVDGLASRYLYDAQGNVECVVRASWVANSCPTAATGQTIADELLSDNVYDYRSRLIAVRSYNWGSGGDKTEYRYDPLSRPTKKTATESGATTTTEMVYLGVSDAVVRETETGPATKTRTYAFDVTGDRAGLSETVSGTTSRYSYVYDPLGSAELLLDQTNGVKATYGYTAYGEANPQLTKTAAGFTPNSNLYRYTGKRWDPAAKAYDMGARHYFPKAGRWFQQDTYTNSLDNLDLSTDPLTQNRYAFTGANPINYIEVDGHVAVKPTGCHSNVTYSSISHPCNRGLQIGGPVEVGPGIGARALLRVAPRAVRAAEQTVAGARRTATAVKDAAQGVRRLFNEIHDKIRGVPDGVGRGPHARGSIRARGPERDFNEVERQKIDRLGNRDGCHTCGVREPGTKSRHYVPDHQPPTSVLRGGSQRLFPQCLACSRDQGLRLARLRKNH
jgi:RHS repeat-associated protein